jgi:(4S)-4-hydroxy-5-phosphonooxypentane-2,3-dione isomerase
LLIVNVDIRVKPGMKDAFVRETRPNVEQSRRESGIAAFDLLVDPSDDHHFLLVEAYRTPEAPLAHKETAHYQAWRDAVEAMMQCPRSSAKWNDVFVGNAG